MTVLHIILKYTTWIEYIVKTRVLTLSCTGKTQHHIYCWVIFAQEGKIQFQTKYCTQISFCYHKPDSSNLSDTTVVQNILRRFSKQLRVYTAI